MKRPDTCHSTIAAGVGSKAQPMAAAFSLVEMMVVVALFSLIVLALLTVFNTTQGAFRTSVTQSDVQEGGRAAIDLVVADLRSLAASGSTNFGAVNFYVNTNVYYYGASHEPLIQSMSPGGVLRTNVLQDVFILSRQNQTWTGIGYAVDFDSTNYINPLYRFSESVNARNVDPRVIFTNFYARVNNGDWSGMSRLLQGVVHFTIQTYGTNGQWLANNLLFTTNGPKQVTYFLPTLGSSGLIMYSNTLPAMAQVQLGVLEDRAIRHVESLPYGAASGARSNYLSGQAGKVHLFQQSVSIPNFDPAVYQ